MNIKQLRHQYAVIRKASTQSARRLAGAGFIAPSFPKGATLKTESELQKAIQQARAFMSSPEHTVPGARIAHDLLGVQNIDTQAMLKREKNIFAYSRKKAEQWGLNRFQTNVLRAVRRHGVSGRVIGKRNIKEFAQYVNFRMSVKNQKTKYKISEYAQQYKQMKARGMSVEDVMKDFQKYRADNEKLAEQSLLSNQRYSMSAVQELWNKYEKQKGL